MEGAKHWIADAVETVSEALGGISAEPWDWLWVPKRAAWKKPVQSKGCSVKMF